MSTTTGSSDLSPTPSESGYRGGPVSEADRRFLAEFYEQRRDKVLTATSIHCHNADVAVAPTTDESFVVYVGTRIGEQVVGASPLYVDLATAVRLRDALVDVLGLPTAGAA